MKNDVETLQYICERMISNGHGKSMVFVAGPTLLYKIFGGLVPLSKRAKRYSFMIGISKSDECVISFGNCFSSKGARIDHGLGKMGRHKK